MKQAVSVRSAVQRPREYPDPGRYGPLTPLPLGRDWVGADNRRRLGAHERAEDSALAFGYPRTRPEECRYAAQKVTADTVGFSHPQAIYFSRDVERACAFYRRLGFQEVFRTPEKGTPIHADLELDGYRIGFASLASAREDHGLRPVPEGQRATITLWTQDTTAAYEQLISEGVRGLAGPQVWLDRLLIAWIEDPDGHPVQIVQRLGESDSA